MDVNTLPDALRNDTLFQCGHCSRKHSEVGVKLKRCNACHAAMYCSRECQKAAWPSHRDTCRATQSLTQVYDCGRRRCDHSRNTTSLADAQRGWQQGPHAGQTRVLLGNTPAPRPRTPQALVEDVDSASRNPSPVRESWRFEVDNRPRAVPVQMPRASVLAGNGGDDNEDGNGDGVGDDDDDDDDTKYWAHVPEFADSVGLPSCRLDG
ncbi:hypothetical protein NUW54_g11984 [Trametes sanguinea]|uniref:Uncharacterized protein n=1 Tax=Trametes sanguinea TaxID=158606 RepID=A0ACC1N5I0_9APHY|nr:hypothetical protein NUW54_g11984 [Trametes sanguinea]